MRDRREPTRSNLIPFRIPTQSDAPKLPPAAGGKVVAFKRAPHRYTPADIAQLFDDALELRRAERAAGGPNLWRIAADLWREEHPDARGE